MKTLLISYLLGLMPIDDHWEIPGIIENHFSSLFNASSWECEILRKQKVIVQVIITHLSYYLF